MKKVFFELLAEKIKGGGAGHLVPKKHKNLGRQKFLADLWPGWSEFGRSVALVIIQVLLK